MKRNIYTAFLFLCIIAGFAHSVKAEEALSISNWNVDASVLETGDLSVIDDITFQFDEEFNGVFREVVLDKSSGVTDISVIEIVGNKESKYTLVEQADNGDQGVFVVDTSSGNVLIQIYSPSEDQEKTFQISYVVKNVAIKYNDIGELYYKFLGSENQTPIENFTVNITLPKSITDNSKIFAHGPLNGEIDNSQDTFFLRVKDVPTETFVEARVLFPVEYIPLSTRVINIDNYSNILQEEAYFEKRREEDRQKSEGRKLLFGKISIYASIIGLGLLILSLVAFRRKTKSHETEEYSRIPEDCTPAVAASLTSTPINSTTIIATMLDLFRKGYLKIDNEVSNSKKTDNKDMIITKVKEQNDNLLSHENHFIQWYINDIGNGKSVTSQGMEKYSKEKSSAFSKSYTTWVKKIKEDSILKGYYDKTKGKYATVFVVLSPILLILGILALVFESLIGIACMVVSVLLFINGLSLYDRRSEYGHEQYKKWIGFKKYTKEFKSYSTIDDFSKYPHDSSLIYALSLGVDMKIANKLDLSSESQSLAQDDWIYWFLFFQRGESNSFDRSFDQFHSDSDNSASGGGFSGGGAGGGGF